MAEAPTPTPGLDTDTDADAPSNAGQHQHLHLQQQNRCVKKYHIVFDDGCEWTDATADMLRPYSSSTSSVTGCVSGSGSGIGSGSAGATGSAGGGGKEEEAKWRQRVAGWQAEYRSKRRDAMQPNRVIASDKRARGVLGRYERGGMTDWVEFASRAEADFVAKLSDGGNPGE